MDPEEQHISTNRARAGYTPHIVRFVLVISVTLSVLAMAVILLSYFR